MHPAQQESIQKLHSRISKEIHVNDQMKAIIRAAIEHCLSDKNWRPTQNTNDAKLKKGIKAQNKIGWHHMIYGRLTKEFVASLTATGDSNNLRSIESLGRKLIKAIWDTFLALWHQRNEVVHGTTFESKKQAEQRALEQKVYDCYDWENKLPIDDRRRIFQTSKEEKLKEDPRNIKTWIRLANRIIQTNKHELKKEQGQRKLMENYFKWNPPDQRGRRSKPLRLQHRKNDLKPD
jgi:hypothetical protein